MRSIDERQFMNHAGITTTVTGENLTAAEALDQGGLNWKVGLVDAGFRIRGGVFKASTSGRRALCRLNDEGVPEYDYGFVGRRYHPIQNDELFSWADALVDGAGANFEAAWSMYDGAEVGLTMRFPEEILIAGEDPHAKYLLLRARHDGTGSMTASVAMVRMFCTNQLDYAVRGADRTLRIRHTANATSKLAAAREALRVTSRYETAFNEQMEALIQRTIDEDTADAIIREVLSAQRWGGLDEKVAQIKGLARESQTIQDDYRGTRYGLLQAATEWLDWGNPGRSAKGQLNDLLDGRIHRAKDALVTALSR